MFDLPDIILHQLLYVYIYIKECQQKTPFCYYCEEKNEVVTQICLQ